jgi:hypothetical protein
MSVRVWPHLTAIVSSGILVNNRRTNTDQSVQNRSSSRLLPRKVKTIIISVSYLFYYYLFKLQVDFYLVAVVLQ